MALPPLSTLLHHFEWFVNGLKHKKLFGKGGQGVKGLNLSDWLDVAMLAENLGWSLWLMAT